MAVKPTSAQRRRPRRNKSYLLALPASFWLVIFFLVPLTIVVAVSFWERGPRGTLIHEFTTENYKYVDETYRPILERSLMIALRTTLICFALGYPLAFFISTRKKTWVRQLSLFLVILPFWTNFLIRTYAWRVLLGNDGIINHYMVEWGLRSQPIEVLYTPTAVLIGLVYGFLPFMVLPIYATIERFDFRLVEAAHDLGANDWWAFWRVVFPITLPGVVAGSILVFIPAVGSYITPDLLGGRSGLMVGNLIARNFRGTGHWPRGAASSIAMMGIVIIGLVIYMLVVERGESKKGTQVSFFERITSTIMQIIFFPLALLSELYSTIARNITISQDYLILRDRAIRQIGKIGLWLNPIFCYAFLWLPIIILVFFSFNNSRSTGVWRGFSTRWYSKIFNSVTQSSEQFSTQLMFETLQNSMIVSIFATLIATVIGTLVAMAIVRGRFRGKGLVGGLLYLPVAIPEIAQGISLLLFFNLLFDFLQKNALYKAFHDAIQSLTGYDLQLSFGFATIIIAHVAFNISFVAIVVRARLMDMNPRLEEAARDLGANELKTFRRVTLPLILPGVLAGALLAFTLSLDDFVVTFFTSGVGSTTLTVYVYGLLKLTVTPEINALSSLMILASTIIVGLSLALQGRNASQA